MPFRDIVGHRKMVELLARSAARQAVPPSLIFAGPSGDGKRPAALALAQAVNCPQPLRGQIDGTRLEFDACGTCAACSRIARGLHPDVIRVVKPGDKTSIPVDLVRGLLESSYYRPFEGMKRVGIVEEADLMQPAAQSALLKLLEEPPPASMFVLVTSRPDALLQTVLSRCPRLRFAELEPHEVTTILMRMGMEETKARTAAVESGGSLERALEGAGDEFAGTRERALQFAVAVARGSDPRRRLEASQQLLPKSTGKGAADRDMLAVELRALASILRDVALLSVSIGEQPPLSNPDYRAELEQLDALAGERGREAFLVTDKALLALRSNANAKTVADWLALNI
jgi:DNA polymerase-3 subunit delta'